MYKVCTNYISKEMLKGKQTFGILMLGYADVVSYISCLEMNCNNIGALSDTK